MAQSENKYATVHFDLEGIIQKDKPNEYFCCICNEIISKKDLMLKHVNTKSHIKASEIFIKYFQVAKSVTIKCKICQVTGSWKLVKHHVEMHKLTPWYEPKDKYKCKTPKHQYMISCGTYVTNKFPSEVERFLMSFEENTEELLKFSLIAEKAKENKILTCLKTDTISAFNKVEAYAYGSRICGSGLPDSDINIFLDCLNTYNGKDVCSKQLKATVKTINSILLSKPSVWHVNEIILDDRIAIMKVWYIPMKLHCTISFKNGLDVESTNLIKHFNETYLPCRKLILILKKWLSFCGISGFPCISNYALTWCIIFYLQIMFILPSITELIQENNKSKLIDGWQTGVSYEFSARKTFKFPFVKLLSGFFIFYAEFDYRRHIICPLLGKPIERKIFTDLSLLPNDMAPYVQYVRNAKNPKLFCLTPMCVQDPFNLSDNLTVMVEKSTLNNFRIFCSKSAETLIDLF
ncbi:terminal uridylyltransferase Tailor-like isoform X4 [Vespa velutina]|uniref:terminal uridylyltransferase Tailor-like isoform X4 n=1 Tax=Vespa velutina TaxID=202808 RepID=UPI001FB2155A|nr:terminal uridylyltransferase Tailor-like isoform X4 [Vespa velutina]